MHHTSLGNRTNLLIFHIYSVLYFFKPVRHHKVEELRCWCFRCLTSQMRLQSRRRNWPQPARLASHVTPLAPISLSRLRKTAKASENHDKTHDYQTWIGGKEKNAHARISFLIAGIGESICVAHVRRRILHESMSAALRTSLPTGVPRNLLSHQQQSEWLYQCI